MRDLTPAIVCAAVLGAGVEWAAARPLDIPTEHLERPRPEADRPPGESPSLAPSDALRLAKARAKQALGPAFDDYGVKAVVFDPGEQTWSVTFSAHKPAQLACLIVFVKDASRETHVIRCR